MIERKGIPLRFAPAVADAKTHWFLFKYLLAFFFATCVTIF